MGTDTKNRAPQSSAARRKPRKDSASETDYVAREAAEAKSALLASIDNLKTSAVNSLDVRRWAQRYPLRTAGAALLAGFALAALARGPRPVVANNDDDSPPDEAAPVHEPQQATSASEPSSQNAFLALIITALMDVLKVAAQNFLMNAFRPQPDPAPTDVAQSNQRDRSTEDLI
jgi:hypothetical protein